MGMPSNRHARYQMIACVRLAAVMGEERVRGETGIRFAGGESCACDAALLHMPIRDNRLLLPAELLLVIEVADRSIKRDMIAKRAAYALAGIPHYWVVDVERRIVHRLCRPRGHDYLNMRDLTFGSPMRVPGASGTIRID